MSPQAAPTIVARRVDLPGELAGFSPPPPCRVHLKFLAVDRRWVLLAMTEPGLPTKLARWLEPFGPDEINISPGLAPKILRATFTALPPRWQELVDAVVVHYIQLTPEGSASIFVEDSPDKVQGFVAKITGTSRQVRNRKTLASTGRAALTPRQLEVLSLAVALGYYETPHNLSLRDLAKKLGLSVGAVSELLRRGEGIIITNYIDSMSASKWNVDEGPR